MSVGREGVFPIPCSWTLPTGGLHARGILLPACIRQLNAQRSVPSSRVAEQSAETSAGSAETAIQSHIIYDLLW